MIHLATLRGRLYWRLLQHVCSLISQSARSPGLVVLIQIKIKLFYLWYSYIKFVDVIVSATRSIFLLLPPSIIHPLATEVSNLLHEEVMHVFKEFLQVNENDNEIFQFDLKNK